MLLAACAYVTRDKLTSEKMLLGDTTHKCALGLKNMRMISLSKVSLSFSG